MNAPATHTFRIAVAPESGPLRRALEKVFGPLLAAGTGEESSPVVGLVIPLGFDGRDWVDQAATILRRHGHSNRLVVAHHDQESLYNGLRASLQAPFREGVRFVCMDGKLLNNLIKTTLKFSRQPPSKWSMGRVREVIYAKEIYQLLEGFSHGGRRDITNQVAAPLRLLMSARRLTVDNNWKKAATDVVASFKRLIIEDPRFAQSATCWPLASELRTTFQTLDENWRWKPRAKPDLDYVLHLDRFMDLLTECRVLAGEKSKAENDRAQPVPSILARNNKKRPFQVLVVDDHAQSWHPVFQLLQRHWGRVGESDGTLRSVQFDFSTDGQTVAVDNERTDLFEAVPNYDTVLIDIFLARGINGNDLLARIRRHYMHVPVIIWTTSRASDLPAEAQLAHGFLFKKETTLKQMAELLTARIAEGSAKRRYALPGHFFDHSIRNERNRKCALRFTEYCSKQLDSFHALDDQFFRFFTDHGGRHLFKLLEYLGNVLRPLVTRGDVFSQDDPEQREKEILSFYLAVFLHEFGMFPLRVAGKKEDWSKLNESERKIELGLVRALHAMRGMVMLARKPNEHWPDEESEYQARKRLFAKGQDPYVQKAVALITGYHSRLLPIPKSELADKDFAKWDVEASEQLGKKAASALGDSFRGGPNDALKQISTRFFNKKALGEVLADLKSGLDKNCLRRLHKHCAIFRFVDAIDVDHTRNPAEFLSLNSKVSPIDCRETLKRQVIRKVRTEGGVIRIRACVPHPSHGILVKILGLKAPDPEHPWNHCDDAKAIMRLSKHQKKLDAWLGRFWKRPDSDEAKKIVTIDERTGKPTFDSKMDIAKLTALSVAWEIVDEYDAIVKCGLKDVVRLGDFKWRSVADQHSNRKLRNMLTMLFHKNGFDRRWDEVSNANRAERKPPP